MSTSPLNMSPRKHFSLLESSFSSSQGSGSSTPTRRGTFGRVPSDLGTSDRFIPSRATSKLNVNLWDSMSDRKSPRNNSSQSEDSANEQQASNSMDDSNTTNNGSNRQADSNQPSQSNLHNVLLRSELLGENISPYSGSHMAGNIARMSGVSQPLRDGMNRLRFHSPRQAFQENMFNESIGATSVVNSFSLTPVGSAGSQRLMAAPQKRRRRIAKVPFKVLDAPALQDDFYLNLVDWSSQNVLAVGLGSCVYLWSACTSKVTKLCDLAPTEDLVTSVSWAQRGTHLAVGTNRGEVQLWDTIKCKKIRTMAGHSARVGTLAWTGPTLASGSRDRLIFLRDVRVQASFTDRLAAHKQEVCGLKWSFDEPSFLASGGNDNQLHVVDSRNPSSPVHRFSDHTAAVKAIAWSPHQHGLLASGGGTADRCIRFWNTLSGSSLNCVDTGSQVCNLAWSQNCNEIVSTHGYSLNQIVVWRYPSLSKVVTLTGHTYRVLYLAMSPDGSTIVTGAGDETLRFWQIFPGPRSDGKNNTGGLLFPNTLGSVIR
jgi:cell division cycle 20-like protein 1 (cofactor of APC complex)